MYDAGLCFTFADDGGGGVSDSHHEDGGGGARGGRGRPRGQRRGRERTEGRGQDSDRQRFSSADNFNSGRRGGRDDGFRDRGRQGRGRDRDQSYDSSRGRRGHADRDGGGRGYGGGGEGRRGYGDRGGGGEGRRGRGGFQGSNRGGRPRNFPLRLIAGIEDIDDVTLRLTSQLEEFEAFVSSDSMSPDDAMTTLKILSRVFQNDLQRESVLKVLQVVCTSRFLDMHLTTLIHKLPSFLEIGSQSKVFETVDFIHRLISQVCLKLPSFAVNGYLLLLALNSQLSVIRMLEQSKPSLAEDLVELLGECQRCSAAIDEAGQKKEHKARFRRGPNDDDDIPPDDFAQLPIFPSARDMDWTEKIFLRANKEEGSFRNVNHYLDVQFRLLREDYIRPLRKGIKEFKQLTEKGDVFKKNHDLRLYNKVQIISMVCQESLEHRVQFDVSQQLKRVRWQSSKRLIYGSLVCLSLDDFDTIFFAVVTNRDIKDLEKGIVQIRFESGLDDILDMASLDTFTMAETTAYFESYRHVLEGLKEMKDNLPMSRYLVECKPVIKPPRYLLSALGTGRMDVSALLRHGSGYDASAVTVINPRGWPPLDETTLNASQMEAVQTALSKELAIIQGPPGTGKTYVGLKVARILLQNRRVWTDPEVGSRPILVVCYTNHALDQFLEGILDFCPEGIVRVGSRCKNPQLEEFNLKNIRREKRTERKVGMSVRNSIRDCFRGLKELKEKIDSVSARLEATTKGIVSAAVLQHHMVQGHYNSLTGTAAAPQTKRHDVMMEWLSNGIVTQAGDEEQEDPYAMLAKEMTSQILQGQDTCQEDVVDPNRIHSVSPIVRAQLYRFWVQKVKTVLQQDVAMSRSQGQDPKDSLKWQQAAKREILPDAILQRVISSHIFSAITYPSAQQQGQQEQQLCVRAWLGISEGSSQEAISAIVEGGSTCNEGYFTPGDVVGLPRKTRIELYRFWLGKVRHLMEGQRKQNLQRQEVNNVLALARKSILPDNVLKIVVNPKLLDAIRREMIQRHQRQSQYLIRAWLGIQEFCQNALDLERLLEQLEDGVDTKDEEEKLNVDEDAEFIQNERQLDVDDEDDLFNFGKKKSRLDVKSAMQELGVQPTTFGTRSVTADTEEDGFSVPKYHMKKQIRKLQSLLTSSKPMTQEEAAGVTNLWSQKLSVENRIRLYLFWLRQYQDWLRQSVKSHGHQYNTSSQQLRELRMGEDKDILVEATVIGMTTTGAARYRRVLKGVACPIIILEEAAEVLEAHVVTTLHQKCQHLILIGDHQQLKPSPTVFELCRQYNLDLSLFERLINNRLHHATLDVQHRMRPEVARLVRHVYPELKDHETTLERPHIRGVKTDVFLFHHEVEETCNGETSSKSNLHEAELCVRLCRYLLQQGYPPDTITVLTAYSGQVFTFRTIMKKREELYQGVRVTAVDNYQGEENDVIILSLVRSNQEGSVGFLGTDNRVCVALSRARNGFYAFGNFRILADSSQLWTKICRTAKENGQLGDKLVLRCENHPEKEIGVTTTKDFDKAPEGGCRLPCGARLDCGHACTLTCHGYDRQHKKYRCRKKCSRDVCEKGHACPKKCFEDCGQCAYKVEKTVPVCGHVATMQCSTDPSTWNCTDHCQGTLPCQHPCNGECGHCRMFGGHSGKCIEHVEREGPCGHLVKSPCHVPLGEWPCTKPCGVTLDCGHVCQGTCGQCWAGRVHVTCKAKCGRELPGCGHKCRLPCGTECLPCKDKCSSRCRHSNCKQPCGTPCLPCKEPCPWRKCQHQQCESLCQRPCKPCPQPCDKKVRCEPRDPEHPHDQACSGLCGEKCFCFTCDKKDFVSLTIAGVLTEEESQRVGEHTKLIKLPRCGHIFNVDVLDVYFTRECESLPPGGTLTCPVATCNTIIIETDCWRYHHLLRARQWRLQKAKRDLVTTTTTSSGCRQKLLDSLHMLTHDAEREKSFASKATLGQLFREDVPIDVNAAFALTNQIKLARVFEMSAAVLRHLENRFGDQRDVKDAEVLKKMLYKRTDFLTQQRLRELSAATRRFVYLTKLAYAKKYSVSVEFKDTIQSCFASLESQASVEPGVARDVDKILDGCKKNHRSKWDASSKALDLAKAIDLSILDAPPEQDLCDVGTSRTSTPRVGSVTARGSSTPAAPHKLPNSTLTLPTTAGEAMPLDTPHPDRSVVSGSRPGPSESPSTDAPHELPSSTETLPTVTEKSIPSETPHLDTTTVSRLPRPGHPSEPTVAPHELPSSTEKASTITDETMDTVPGLDSSLVSDARHDRARSGSAQRLPGSREQLSGLELPSPLRVSASGSPTPQLAGPRSPASGTQKLAGSKSPASGTQQLDSSKSPASGTKQLANSESPASDIQQFARFKSLSSGTQQRTSFASPASGTQRRTSSKSPTTGTQKKFLALPKMGDFESALSRAGPIAAKMRKATSRQKSSVKPEQSDVYQA